MCEMGWAETIQDLMQDARLWLLYMNGEIKAVILLFFTKVKLKPEVASELNIPTTSSNNGATPSTSSDHKATLPTTISDHKINMSTIASPSITVSPITGYDIEKSLIDIINEKADINLLARSLFYLNKQGKLKHPLLGNIHASYISSRSLIERITFLNHFLRSCYHLNHRAAKLPRFSI